jgi:hypothetical protein
MTGRPPGRALAGAVAGWLAVLALAASGASGAFVGALVPPPGTFTQLSAGHVAACAVRTDGTLACWGDPGTVAQFPVPAGTFTQVSVGTGLRAHACALRTDQTLACWGLAFVQATPAGTFVAVALADDKACAVRTDGTLACWGDPLAIGLPELSPPPAGTFTALALSNGSAPHACALASDQTLTCWANNNVGQATPPAAMFISLGVFAVAGCAIRIDHTAACWGADTNGDTHPPPGAFASVSTNTGQTCAVRTDQTVACWGDSLFGRGAPPPGAFTQVAVGDFTFTCGLRTDQTLACWGAEIAFVPDPPAAAGAPTPAAPTAPGTAAAAGAGAAGARLPRLPAAFGKNGVFALPSNHSCVSRRYFRIRIRRQRAGVTLLAATVALNGHRVATRKGKRLTAPVDLRGLPKGRFTVGISALTSDGRAVTGTRQYRTCAAKRPAGGRGPLVLAAAASVALGGRAAAAAGAMPVLGAVTPGSVGAQGFGHAHQ